MGFTSAATNAQVVDLFTNYRTTNVNLRDKDGKTPLFIAADEGNLTAAKSLLRASADPNAMTAKGQSPLSIAIEHKNYPMINLLQQGGATTAPTSAPVTK